MWPAMIEEPISPGRGLAVYQPATDVLVGTCRVPWAVRPSLIRRVRTPMAGIVRATGRDTGPRAAAAAAPRTTPRGAGDALASGRATCRRAAGQPAQPDRAAHDHDQPGQQHGPGQRAADQPEAAPVAGTRGLPVIRVSRAVLPGTGYRQDAPGIGSVRGPRGRPGFRSGRGPGM